MTVLPEWVPTTHGVNETGGEQYIISAVMHADERNKSLSEELDRDVFHYHLHVVYIPVVEFQVKQEKQKLAALENKVELKKNSFQHCSRKQTVEHTALTSSEINNMGRKNLRGKMELEPPELENLKVLARVGLTAPAEISDLKRKLKERTDDARKWRERYEKLLTETKDFLAAVKRAPERVRAFIKIVLGTTREQPEIGREHKNVEHER